jgi:hypothetical protein
MDEPLTPKYIEILEQTELFILSSTFDPETWLDNSL